MMTRTVCALCLSAAVAISAFVLGLAPASAGDRHEGSKAARFSDDYAGYHLRPPYYLPELGWHTPPKGNRNRALYFGYHFHEPARPLTIYDVNQRVAHRRATVRDHVDWCCDRYRSYRVSDNSFQPNHGWRQQCNSPFD